MVFSVRSLKNAWSARVSWASSELRVRRQLLHPTKYSARRLCCGDNDIAPNRRMTADPPLW
jgi:hypothetical protein